MVDEGVIDVVTDEDDPMPEVRFGVAFGAADLS